MFCIVPNNTDDNVMWPLFLVGQPEECYVLDGHDSQAHKSNNYFGLPRIL